MSGRVILLVGTKKGLFTFESDAERRNWRETGPLLASWEVNGLVGDSRRGHRLLAGTGHAAYGPTIRVSPDFGQTWTQVLESPRYTPESGRFVRRIWQIVCGPEPDTYYAGVDEAGLFVSADGGLSWRQRDTLGRDPTRSRWSRTQAGNPLHSLVAHPADARRIWGLVGGAGVVYSGNGGVDWEFRNAGLPPAGDSPDLTQGVHRLAADPAAPEHLYLQHTDGTFASDDGGAHWERIDAGLPSRFGFALEVSPAGDVYTVPLDRETRCFPGGRPQVYRRRRGGDAWERAGEALPSEPHFVGVLRDALAVDGLSPSGIYFGTTQGDLFASPDAGASWLRLPGQFSRIHTVRVWQLGLGRAVRRPPRGSKPTRDRRPPHVGSSTVCSQGIGTGARMPVPPPAR